MDIRLSNGVDDQNAVFQQRLRDVFDQRSGIVHTTQGVYKVVNMQRPWQPSSLSLDFWLDGADSRTLSFSSGFIVDTWYDKINNIAGVAPLLNQPLYDNGFKAVYFDQSGSHYQWLDFGPILPSTSLTGLTVYVVARTPQIATSGTFPTVFSKAGLPANDNEWLIYRSGGNSFAQYRPTTAGSAGVNPVIFNELTRPHIFSLQYNNVTSTLTHGIDGSLNPVPTVLSTSSTIPAVDNVFLARNSVGGTFAFQTCYVFEVVATLSVLTPLQQRYVEGYLAHKWNTTSDLPSTHMFKTQRPLEPVLDVLAQLPYDVLY